MNVLLRAMAGLLVGAAALPANAQADQNGNLLATPGIRLTGALMAAGTSAPVYLRGNFNFSLWGTFTATCELDRSFDRGATWLPLTAIGTPLNWSVPASETFSEVEAGVAYRVNCTSYTSGTINYRVSL